MRELIMRIENQSRSICFSAGMYGPDDNPTRELIMSSNSMTVRSIESLFIFISI